VAIVALPALFVRRLRPIAFALLAGFWTFHQFQVRLDDRLDPGLSNQTVSIQGVVSSIPSVSADSVRFLFQAGPGNLDGRLPESLLLTWYRNAPDISVGESWQLEVKLKPPWGNVNFQGPDKERWLFAGNIGGLGTVRSGQKQAPASGWRYMIQLGRERIHRSIERQVRDERQRGVVQALATANRSGMSPSDRALLAATGTAHLLAISGLHVGLAAAGGAWLGRLFFLFLPLSWMGGASMALCIAGGLISSTAYAALAGFGIPTLRAILMLATALSALVFARSIHPARAWVISLTIVLLIDPFAPLGAGLWFSFLAVAALLWIFLPRVGVRKRWKTLLMAQAAVILTLAPISAIWFGAISPAGFFANLFAIPWVSLLVVPPVLTGLVTFPFSEALAGLLWSAAGFNVSLLFHFLETVSLLQGRIISMASPNLAQAFLAVTGAAIFLLPRGIQLRWMGLFLVVPLFLPSEPEAAPKSLQLEILDVGQGTAALVSSGGTSLLYDAGPGDGRSWNLVTTVIEPALTRLGAHAPDTVIISHGDLDHAGGLHSLLEHYPEANYLANLGSNRVVEQQCTKPLSLPWPGVEADVLHPSPWLPYQGNNSSCVVSIGSAGGKLLLSGDISAAIENRLLHDGLTPHRLLLVPHHGSATSSSKAFIERLKPEVAVATASLGNRFGFPDPEIRRRYEAAGVLFWSTGDCGAIRIVLEPDGVLHAVSARRNRMHIWRWPPAANCP